MNYNSYLDIRPDILHALQQGRPVVALESTILSHGMPYPQNLGFAKQVEEAVRSEGAVPATIALIGGRIKIGLDEDALELMCRGENVAKISRRDMAACLARKATGATTVASTMLCAAMAGIRVFATGGIGGVHRLGEQTMDISADLQELGNTPVCVVCAGAKQILDIGRTLEYLETMGVPVIGYKTDKFPAFYCPDSGFGVDYRADSPEAVAEIIRTSADLGLKGGMLVGNPVPPAYAQDFDKMEGIIQQAMAEADKAGVHGKAITPFLLAKIVELTGGDSLATNIQLALNNARVAAKIAASLAKLQAQ